MNNEMIKKSIEYLEKRKRVTRKLIPGIIKEGYLKGKELEEQLEKLRDELLILDYIEEIIKSSEKEVKYEKIENG